MKDNINHTPEINHQTGHERHHHKPKYEGLIVLVILIILSFFSQYVFDWDDVINQNKNAWKSKNTHKNTVNKSRFDTIIYINHIGFKDTFIKEGNKVYNHGVLINSKIRYEQ